MSRRILVILLVVVAVAAFVVVAAFGQAKGKKTTVSGKSSGDYRPDIVTAVKAAAKKDCGCGMCAAKGCAPCKGKNCYFCVSKALVASDCGCKGCNGKGCKSCGPGCDVCKFHLAPVAAARTLSQKPKK